MIASKETEMGSKQGSAFITTKKGFCYLTVKCGRRNFHVMRIRKYKIEAEEKRDMRRLYPDVVFDWKKIGQQLAEKREVCRSYRSRRRTSNPARSSRARETFNAVFDPMTRTVYADEVPSTLGGAASLLDAMLDVDRTFKDAPRPLEARRRAKPKLELVKSSGRRKTGDGGR